MENFLAIFPHNGKHFSTLWKIQHSRADPGGSPAFLPLAEEADEGAGVGFAGVEFDGVGVGAGELGAEGFAAGGLLGEEGAAPKRMRYKALK